MILGSLFRSVTDESGWNSTLRISPRSSPVFSMSDTILCRAIVWILSKVVQSTWNSFMVDLLSFKVVFGFINWGGLLLNPRLGRRRRPQQRDMQGEGRN